MSSYRLNLTIDDCFDQILRYFKSKSPLLSDIEIIRKVIGEKYIELLEKDLSVWSNSLPELALNPDELKQLEDNLTLSIASGSSPWNSQDFIKEMQS